MPQGWVAPDLTEDQLKRVDELISELEDIFPEPVQLAVEDIRDLTEEQAQMVRLATRRMLVLQLLHQERHWHEMDDCGDYLVAATENWAALYGNLWTDDFQDEVEETKKFLVDSKKYPEGGCDGEIRYSLLPVGEDEILSETMARVRTELG
jgi:hypothetical protein